MNFQGFANSLQLIKNIVYCKLNSWHTPKGAFISQSTAGVAIASSAQETPILFIPLSKEVFFSRLKTLLALVQQVRQGGEQTGGRKAR